jgi:hypothetical protein
VTRRRKNQKGTGKTKATQIAPLLTEVATQIDQLIATADRTADAVESRIGEARNEPGTSRHDILAAELATVLAERVQGLREEAHRLRGVLERGASAFGAGAEVAPTATDPVEPDDVRTPDAGGPEALDAPSQGLLLLVTQMAVAGSDREEIAARLRDDFGVSDTDEVLSRALGESP